MSERFEKAVAAFQAIHREDPRTLTGPEGEEPHSSLYHRRLAHWVDELRPDAPEALRLAAWCQHLRRWALPRSEYPEGLSGYKRWRSELARRHASDAEEVLRGEGYGDETVARVRALLIKKGLRVDADVQTLEDAICLTFLENEYADFAAKHPDEKVVDILAKTWKKMSPQGHEAALALAPALEPRLRALVEEAVAG